MKYFNNCKDLNELKKEYRRLAMANHPDHGGDPEIMKDINNQYQEHFQILKNHHNSVNDAEHQTTEAPEEFINIISALLKLNVTVELCGCWLWISGDTKAVKEDLKQAGCRWSSSKKMWYWRHKEDGSHWSKGKKTMSQIRMKYGSQTFTAGNAVGIEA